MKGYFAAALIAACEAVELGAEQYRSIHRNNQYNYLTDYGYNAYVDTRYA